MNLLSKIRNVPDFPKPGIQFKDITTLLEDGAAFRYVSDRLEERYKNSGLTKVVGIESRGFIFGSVLADRLKVGFVPVRKEGKLPGDIVAQSYDLEYGSATIEMHKDAVGEKDRVLVVDDLMATGGTLKATCDLILGQGAAIHEVWVLMELTSLSGRDHLSGLPVFSELQIGEE